MGCIAGCQLEASNAARVQELVQELDEQKLQISASSTNENELQVGGSVFQDIHIDVSKKYFMSSADQDHAPSTAELLYCKTGNKTVQDFCPAEEDLSRDFVKCFSSIIGRNRDLARTLYEITTLLHGYKPLLLVKRAVCISYA